MRSRTHTLNKAADGIGVKRPPMPSAALLIGLLLAAPWAIAQDFTGVQPAALDQPRIYLHLQRDKAGPAMSAKVAGQSVSAIECFLDTGASCIAISHTTAKSLDINHELTQAGTPVEFHDVGVGGGEEFAVSQPLYFSTADYSSNTDGENNADYSPSRGPVRCELRINQGMLDLLTGGLDVAGMPAILNHVMVLDTRPVNSFMDKIKTSLLPPGDKKIPGTDVKVALSLVSFAGFTRITPSGAVGPTVAPNPMIGPNPFDPADHTPAPIVSYHGNHARITMLLDTGAVCSMISRDVAKKLGVTYSPDGSKLLGVPADQQFSLAIGGIGGQKTSHGFFLDVLEIPTDQKKPLRYIKAPVLVSDISVSDPKTGKIFTLDGVFGMNFLVASAAITGGLLPDIGKLVQGPFSYVVIDPTHHSLGLSFMNSK